MTVTADFAATPISGSAPLTVTFTNLSTSSGKISSCWWDFGDGSTLLTTGGHTSTLQSPTHVYTEPWRTHTVTLTGWYGGHAYTVVKEDHISVEELVVDFYATPTMGDVPLTVSLATWSGPYDRCRWELGDGAVVTTTPTLTSTICQLSHTYTQAGQYTVEVTPAGRLLPLLRLPPKGSLPLAPVVPLFQLRMPVSIRPTQCS